MANSENITLRSVKGLALSYAEADLNFTELQNLIIDFESLVSTVYPAQQQQIDDVVQDMGELLIDVSDAIEVQDQKIDNIEIDYGNLDIRVSSLEIANADYTNIFLRLDEHDLDIEEVNERVDSIDDAVIKWVDVNSNVTLTVNRQYAVDFTANRVLTLQSTPEKGDRICIYRAAGNPSGSVIQRGGSTIMGLSEHLNIDVNVNTITLIYNGTTWRVIA